MTRVALHTLGCRTNQAELDETRRALVATGRTVEFVRWGDQADVYLLHTCTVTARADRQCRQKIHQARRRSPGSRIVVTGCYANVAQETLEAIEGVSVVLGMGERGRVLEEVLGDAQACDQGPRPEPSTRTRALLKVQEGCDHRCAYCIVPEARGKPRSVGAAEVIRGASELAAAGHPEIVVCGTHIGRWGADLGDGRTLANLVEEVLSEVPRVRVRLSSLDPHELTGELLELITREERVCRHLHLSLQHTVPEVLRSMGRAAGGLDAVRAAASALPGMAIGADVIAAYPTEDEGHFQSLCRDLARAPLTYLHVFGFSPRPGTVAATLDSTIPAEEKARRVALLRELSETRLRPAFLGTLVGRVVDVVVEREDQGSLVGISSEYATVRMQGPAAAFGTLVQARVTVVQGAICQGMLL